MVLGAGVGNLEFSLPKVQFRVHHCAVCLNDAHDPNPEHLFIDWNGLPRMRNGEKWGQAGCAVRDSVGGMRACRAIVFFHTITV